MVQYSCRHRALGAAMPYVTLAACRCAVGRRHDVNLQLPGRRGAVVPKHIDWLLDLLSVSFLFGRHALVLILRVIVLYAVRFEDCDSKTADTCIIKKNSC